jgi:hypothetical protein
MNIVNNIRHDAFALSSSSVAAVNYGPWRTSNFLAASFIRLRRRHCLFDADMVCSKAKNHCNHHGTVDFSDSASQGQGCPHHRSRFEAFLMPLSARQSVSSDVFFLTHARSLS